MAKKKTSPSAGAASEGAKAPAARRRSTSATTSAPRVRAAARSADSKATDPTYAEIAEAAYRRYLSRGGAHGRDFDDWLEAERELRSRR